MKYLLFAFHEENPLGGANDLLEAFDSLEAAKTWAESLLLKASGLRYTHFHIVTDKLVVVGYVENSNYVNWVNDEI